MNTDDELKELVFNDANEIESVVRGELYTDDSGEFTCEKPCEDAEPVSLFDYFERRLLSIEHWKIDRSGECVGGCALLSFGGPNVYVDDCEVRGYWGTSFASRCLTTEARDAVLEYFSETMPVSR